MSAGSRLSVSTESEQVRAERHRIAGCAYEHADEIADDVMAKICAQLPGYATAGPGVLDDVHDQLARLSRTGLGALLEHRRVHPADVAYARPEIGRAHV